MFEQTNIAALVWKLVSALLALLFVGVVGCQVHEDRTKAELIAKGADPIKVRCAFAYFGSASMAAICAGAR